MSHNKRDEQAIENMPAAINNAYGVTRPGTRVKISEPEAGGWRRFEAGKAAGELNVDTGELSLVMMTGDISDAVALANAGRSIVDAGMADISYLTLPQHMIGQFSLEARRSSYSNSAQDPDIFLYSGFLNQ